MNPDSTNRFRLRSILIPAFVLVLIALLASCIVMVDETEYVIVERLGTISAVYDTPESRGLHFKLPWPVEVARSFDRRVQLFDPSGREVFTQDKKNITVSAYMNWRIASGSEETKIGSTPPVVRFYRGLGTNEVAEARLETRLRSVLTTIMGQIELDQLLEVESSEAGPGAPEGGLLAELSVQMTTALRQRDDETESLADRLGIEVVDVRVKRLNFPAGNQQSVYDRMKSERRKIAERYRSAGQADSQMIRSRADRQSQELLARADADAERIRGTAQAEAVGILNEAHALDPEFYQTLRTLDAYRTFINDKTTLVLSSSSKLLKLLTEGIPPADPQPLPAPVSSPRKDDVPEVPAEVRSDSPAKEES